MCISDFETNKFAQYMHFNVQYINIRPSYYETALGRFRQGKCIRANRKMQISLSKLFAAQKEYLPSFF